MYLEQSQHQQHHLHGQEILERIIYGMIMRSRLLKMLFESHTVQLDGHDLFTQSVLVYFLVMNLTSTI